MNITFIGTGMMGSTDKANTSILIDNVLFDCGMGTIKQYERLGLKVKDLEYVVISHYHADHFYDIPNLLIGRKIRKELDKVLYIVGPVGISDKVTKLMQFSFGDQGSIEEYANIKFIEMNSNETIKLGNYSLTSYELDHGKTHPNYGYIVKKDDTSIGYTGDTTLCNNYYEMCNNSKYMIVDTTMHTESSKVHIGLIDLKECSLKYNRCTFFAVHRGDYKTENIDRIIFPNDGDKFITK